MTLCSVLWIDQRDVSFHRLPIDVCGKCHSAVIKGDRGLTEVTPNDVLETVLGVHDLGALYQLTVVHAGKNFFFIRIRLLLLIKLHGLCYQLACMLCTRS